MYKINTKNRKYEPNIYKINCLILRIVEVQAAESLGRNGSQFVSIKSDYMHLHISGINV